MTARPGAPTRPAGGTTGSTATPTARWRTSAWTACWFGDRAVESPIADRLLRFFSEECGGDTTGVYEIDGTKVDEDALHPIGLLATNAQGALAAQDPAAGDWVRRLWETPAAHRPAPLL